MKRKLIYIAVALVTFALGVWVVSIVSNDQRNEIRQQELILVLNCVEKRTPSEFSAFWLEFRGAVEREDKQRLFSMMQRCNFNWAPFKGTLAKPVPVSTGLVNAELLTPFEIKSTLPVDWGSHLAFLTYDDFLANYDVIFSESLRQRFVESEPGPGDACDYAITWRQKVLNHLCFEKSATGYKFSGFVFEP